MESKSTSKTTKKAAASITIPKGKLNNDAIAAIMTPLGTNSYNPWSTVEVDTLDRNTTDNYLKIVNQCRFFYKRDPLSSTTINKLVDLGVTDIVMSRENLSDNVYRVFDALKPKLKEFAQLMAHEYLLSGLVVPEIEFTPVTKEQLNAYNIKKYTTLTLPTTMWIRDPATITINSSLLGPKVSYYVSVPDKLVSFITSGGTYPDGTKDVDLYNNLLVSYPQFVTQVNDGAKKVLLNNDNIFRRKPQSYEPYPIPYLESALEALQHKRNLRRMDYSVASRVISAILLFRLGDKDFPLTEDNADSLAELKNQVLWRDGQGNNVERIFQLFANHTLQIDWIMPDIGALISDSKYTEINQEILFALGMPRIIITGESEKSNTSTPEYAMMSPAKTMENFRSHIVQVLSYIVNEVARQNSFNSAPDISFEPINISAFKDFFAALSTLYKNGNISRTTFDNALGINWNDEVNQKEEEDKLMQEKQIGSFAPQPFSPAPTVPNSDQPSTPTDSQNPAGNNQNAPKPTDNLPK